MKHTCVNYIEILIILLPVASPDDIEFVVDYRHAFVK